MAVAAGQTKFQFKDLVWAKMRGFPHWPAKVRSREAKIRCPVRCALIRIPLAGPEATPRSHRTCEEAVRFLLWHTRAVSAVHR